MQTGTANRKETNRGIVIALAVFSITVSLCGNTSQDVDKRQESEVLERAMQRPDGIHLRSLHIVVNDYLDCRK